MDLMKSMDAAQLPYSQRVSVSTLLQMFSSTSASYKYLFFLSLLNLLEESSFSNLHIKLHEVLLEMLTIAWYPHTFFRLSFGMSDRIANELQRLGADSFPFTVAMGTKKRIKEEIAQRDYTNNELLRFVPYRLLTPFFSRELRGVKDSNRNRIIRELAHERFAITRPFYCFSEDALSITIHPDWMLYFHDNLNLVRTFIAWNWLDYMQKRNPSVPNIQMKLFPPQTRRPLTVQTTFWKTVLQVQPLPCIFSGEELDASSFSLDHFLPWSFIAHDQLWNLLPVSRSANSSKSNKLPSLDRYLKLFVDAQGHALSVYRCHPGPIPWHRVVEPYVMDLHMHPEELLDRDSLLKGLKNVIEPLYALARTQGFSSDWTFENPVRN